MYMRYIISTSRCAWLFMVVLLGACASQIPLAIKEAPADNPSLENVHGSVAEFVDRAVRWGGEILETENREDATWLTVLARPLSKNGKPKDTDESPGRFIAIVPGFLDPKVYSAERYVTVSGTLLRDETGTVGEYPYNYPVIQVQEHYLWPKEQPLPAGYYPWWRYDPWYYDPWYYDRYYYPRYYYKKPKKD
jgi:outer membrane lipoprotein